MLRLRYDQYYIVTNSCARVSTILGLAQEKPVILELLEDAKGIVSRAHVFQAFQVLLAVASQNVLSVPSIVHHLCPEEKPPILQKLLYPVRKAADRS